MKTLQQLKSELEALEFDYNMCDAPNGWDFIKGQIAGKQTQIENHPDYVKPYVTPRMTLREQIADMRKRQAARKVAV